MQLNSLKCLSGKKVFVTGHTGFSGSWLTIWLNALGCSIYGYSLNPPSKPNNYDDCSIKNIVAGEWIENICDGKTLMSALLEVQPEIIFHLAAQSLVSEGYREPLETIESNVLGTARLLNCVRLMEKPCSVIVVTSDKCYHNPETSIGLSEDDKLGGKDPYSASKGAAEIITESFRHSYFDPQKLQQHGVQLASIRAGNIIGGGDWSINRIVPDIVRALYKNETVKLRNPLSNRPWQHVCDPLYGYLLLASKMMSEPSQLWSSAWNFGPSDNSIVSVKELTNSFISAWGEGNWEAANSSLNFTEAVNLQLNCEKARKYLGWKCIWNIEEAIQKTSRWYLNSKNNVSARDLCESDILEYVSLIES